MIVSQETVDKLKKLEHSMMEDLPPRTFYAK